MFHRIRRRAKEPSEAQRQFAELSARLQNQVPPGFGVPPVEPERTEPTTVVDDFLLPEPRVPSHDQLDGKRQTMSTARRFFVATAASDLLALGSGG